MKFSCLILFVLLSCCSQKETVNLEDSVRRVTYIDNHRSNNENINNAIQNGKVLVGMSKKDVQASLGNPNEIKDTQDALIWIYKKQLIYFQNNTVILIKD
jgi:outer membrane protein assembly factor BamE (lipoprotein component of BamABCDE complex)